MKNNVNVNVNLLGNGGGNGQVAKMLMANGKLNSRYNAPVYR